MSTSEPTKATDTLFWRDLLQAAKYYLARRRTWLALAAISIAAGLILNWSWLVATGVAPVLVAVLPCVVMCAVGLCMNRMLERTDGSQASSAESIDEPIMNAPTPLDQVDQVVPSAGPESENDQSATRTASAAVDQPPALEERRTTDA